MNEAVKAVRNRGMSISKAAKMYEVPRSTLGFTVNNKRTGKHGHPCALSGDEEKDITEGIVLAGTWGFPLSANDVCDIVEKYLQHTGKQVNVFKNNRPGRDWALSFLARHPELSTRLSQNIKRSRANIDASTIDSYSDHLSEELIGIPPGNIINYDETNFTDDPGNSKVIVRRCSRHVERIMDSSKTSTSVMFAATSDGELLPPYIVYKSSHLYPMWIENGIKGARYNRSPSGWFDMERFEDWFFFLILPILKKKPGKKVIIGDNLPSHISYEVIKHCQENNTSFILLPTNATHLTQPLDVAVFKPLKGSWRKVLTEWKTRNRGIIPKAQFPKLLKTAVEGVIHMKENIISGFKACGIIPLDRNKVKKRLPQRMTPENQNPMAWSNVFIDHLEKLRSSEKPSTSRPKRITNIAAGNSISIEDFKQQETQNKKQNKAKKRPRKLKANDCSDTDEEPQAKKSRGSSDEDENLKQSVVQTKAQKKTLLRLKDKDYILIEEVDGVKYFRVGQIVSEVDNKSFEVEFMIKNKGRKEIYFTFPVPPEVKNVCVDNIITKLNIKSGRNEKYVFSNINEYLSTSYR